ncbi:hypothetical protein K505DRAFT_387030 [Melanomma pulvis-pyrius CBS 109.77]|uniref:Uncharacterized protein n=1 Tax=Melanomma pulvis-pyrius CBS 109.77 TaxID=1314802 RepID=A0A6A6X8T0_9PLEO|nr:hypothetical protein K505DRAFT_387030 [Melanomma pulvis-pyrius CBS 109.77]
MSQAIIKKMCDVNSKINMWDMAEDDDTDWNEEQEELFVEYTRCISELLLTGIDAREYAHDLTVGAKDVNWSMNWREQTGIPLSTFQDRWEELKDVPRHPQMHPGDPSNRDPQVSELDLQEYQMLWTEEKTRREEEDKQGKGKGKAQDTTPFEATGGEDSQRRTSALYGGTVEGLTSIVVKLAKIYLPAFSYGYDNDDTAKEGAFHEFLRDVAIRNRTLSVRILEGCLESLNYRLSQMAGADEYLEIMEVAQPNGQSCFEFNTANLRYTMGKETYERMITFVYSHPILFPRPVEGGMAREFLKPPEYLAAAFWHAKLPIQDIKKKLNEADKWARLQVQVQRQFLQHNEEVMEKKRKLCQSFGFISPPDTPRKKRLSKGPSGQVTSEKRRSRGQSMGEGGWK